MWIRGNIVFLLIGLLIILSGCFKGEQANSNESPFTNLDENYNFNEGDGNQNIDEDEQESTETAERELYLIDVNGMVVAQRFQLPIPESKEVASQVLQYLVKEGPITEMLPNGFQAVLPEGTEVLSVNLQEDGTIYVDFSEEFTEYHPEEERKILEAVTYTLTQFDNVDEVRIKVNGDLLEEMPLNGTPIGKGYTRSKGINFIQTDTIDFIASEAVTMYYPAEYNDHRYYIPVTQHVHASDDDLISKIVEALIEGPRYNTNVIHVFNPETTLVETPKMKDGVLELVFNESILMDSEQNIVADEVIETLTRTLTEQRTVEALQIKVENTDFIMNEKGEEYIEPVTIHNFLMEEKL